MKTKEIRNIKKDKIRPKQTNFSILLNYKVHTIDLKIPKGKKKTQQNYDYPFMALYFLITRLLKFSFTYSRASKIFQCLFNISIFLFKVKSAGR